MSAQRKKKNTPDLGKAKILFVGLLLALIWVALWGRAGWVQLYQGPDLKQRAARQTFSSESEHGRRGTIYARNGEILATSVESRSIFIRPGDMKDKPAIHALLSELLKIPEKKLNAILSSDKNFVWVKRQVTDRQAKEVADAQLPGLYLTTEYSRLYPQRSLAGQVVGFVDVDGKGLEGMEQAFEKHMAPGKAKLAFLRDAAGRKLYLDQGGNEVDLDGNDLHLTIDTHVQDATEQALMEAVEKYHGRAGVAVVVEVATGDVLALANYPTFNPNTYRTSSASQRRNRATMDIYEPGSTMKPFLFAAALEEGQLHPDRLINCEGGRYKVGPGYVNDHHAYEWLTANKVLRYSSNIGASKIAQRMGAEKYHYYLSALGFGSRTDLNLPGESAGILRPASQWREFDLAAAAYGQGIGVTALQLAHAYLCIASKGFDRPLRLVRSPVTTPPILLPKRVFSQRTCEMVLDMMAEVVQEDGTGRRARIDGIEMAGKTGTAQKAAKGGYGDEYLSSFVGLVPARDPELLILVMIDEPQKNNAGGLVAAPVVREIAMRTLAHEGKLPDPVPELAADTEASPLHPALAQTDQIHEPVEPGATVPDVGGMTVRRAMEILSAKGIVPVLKGRGTTVTGQRPRPGSPWPEANERGGEDVFILWLS